MSKGNFIDGFFILDNSGKITQSKDFSNGKSIAKTFVELKAIYGGSIIELKDWKIPVKGDHFIKMVIDSIFKVLTQKQDFSEFETMVIRAGAKESAVARDCAGILPRLVPKYTQDFHDFFNLLQYLSEEYRDNIKNISFSARTIKNSSENLEVSIRNETAKSLHFKSHPCRKRLPSISVEPNQQFALALEPENYCGSYKMETIELKPRSTTHFRYKVNCKLNSKKCVGPLEIRLFDYYNDSMIKLTDNLLPIRQSPAETSQQIKKIQEKSQKNYLKSLRKKPFTPQEAEAQRSQQLYKQIAINATNCCAIKYDGSIVCWGAHHGLSRDIPQNFKAQGLLMDQAVCAWSDHNEIKCWQDPEDSLPLPQDLRGILTYIDDSRTFCGIQPDKHGFCWAKNDKVGMPKNISVIQIVGNTFEACAVALDDFVHCYGQEGRPFLDMPANFKAKQLVWLSGGACAISLINNEVQCWGTNYARSFPKGIRAKQISASHDLLCAVLMDDTVTCINGRVNVPITQEKNAIKVVTHNFHACALMKNNSVSCWYFNGGVGAETYQYPPLFGAPPSEMRAKSIAIAGTRACSIDNEDHIWCWGDHEPGEEIPPGI